MDKETRFKETRLDIEGNLKGLRFDRNIFAHLMRYFKAIEIMIELSKKLSRPIKVLDVGCGEVYIPRIFNSSYKEKKSEIVREYVGMDSDLNMINSCGVKVPKSFPIELFNLDITKFPYPFENDSFDLVICLEVLEHIQPEFIPTVLSEMKRIGQGLVLIATPNRDGRSGDLPEHHYFEWSFNEIREEIKKVGMEVLFYAGIYSQLDVVKRWLGKQEYKDVLTKYDKMFASILFAMKYPKLAYNVMWLCQKNENRNRLGWDAVLSAIIPEIFKQANVECGGTPAQSKAL